MHRQLFWPVVAAGLLLPPGCGKAPPDSTGSSAADDLVILYPHDATSVGQVMTVEGINRGESSDIWVIVHPVAMGTYWVQKKATVREQGRWYAKTVIGTVGGVQETFEIMAVGAPRFLLKEGRQLVDWPESEIHSRVIRVTRE